MVNFDNLEDKVLDIKDNLYNQLREIREQVCQFLTTRQNNRFYFAKEINEKINFSVAYRNIDELGMHNAKRMKAEYIEYNSDKKDFLVHGYIKTNNEAVKSEIAARDLDLDSLFNIVDYLAQYQREQEGTAKSAEQIEHDDNEARFGKEYYTNKNYRLYIETQLEPIERILLSIYNNTPENERDFESLPKRIGFALVLREC